MSAAVVMPFLVTDEWRQRAFRHVTDRFAADGWPVIVGMKPEYPWVKADAVGDAVAQTRPGDVLVVHDADVVIDLVMLRLAVGMVECDAVKWAIPYTPVLRLTAAATTRYYETGELPARPELTRYPYPGVAGGGVVVLKHETYRDCPLDPRFLGWGDEDVSWGWALATLHGAPWRDPRAPLHHLWHPQAAQNTQPTSIASHRLRRRYQVARNDPVKMHDLVRVAVKTQG